jgi:methyl coenzyme M reductase subunit D
LQSIPNTFAGQAYNLLKHFIDLVLIMSFDAVVTKIVSRVWSERDANRALELINRIYDLWWEVNDLLHGKGLAERVMSGTAAPGDVKAWQRVYGSMSPQQIEERVRQRLQQLMEAENELRQLLSRYMSSDEVESIIQVVKQSVPYKHPGAEQVLQIQQQVPQQQQQASSSTQSVASLGTTSMQQAYVMQFEQPRSEPSRAIVAGERQTIVVPKNVKRVAIPA